MKAFHLDLKETHESVHLEYLNSNGSKSAGIPIKDCGFDSGRDFPVYQFVCFVVWQLAYLPSLVTDLISLN